MKENKNIPRLRFHEFDEEWTHKIFGDVVKINQGLQIAISERLTEEEHGSLFYITNEFLREDSKTKYFVKDAPDSVKCSEEDVLMTRTGNTGKVVTGVRGVFHNNFFKISFPNSVDRKFLVNFLNLPHTQNMILRLAGTSTIPDLNHSDFYSLKFIAPSLQEQQKIASFLTAVDTKIEHLTKKKNLLKKYKKGVMLRIFSQRIRFKDAEGNDYLDWEEKKLSEVASLLKDGSHGTHKDVVGSKYLLLSAKNIQNGEIKIGADERQISKEDFESIYRNYKLRKGDILLSIVGTIGRVAMMTEQSNLAFQRSVAFFRFGDLNAEFMMQLFMSKNFQNELKRRSVLSAQPGIYLGDLAKIEIMLPCLEEQTQIANFLSAIDDKIKLASIQLEKTQEFKKGLLQQMFV